MPQEDQQPTLPLTSVEKDAGAHPPSRDDRGRHKPIFSNDQLVAGRYKIIRFLAKGGMGEVYEAEDLELRVRIALKTIGPEIIEDQRAIDRFKREIYLSRRVTHSNVCRIFDLGYHRPEEANASAGDITFLTMELLQGETLTERLRRSGRMTPAEALPIVGQMVTALGAAHDVGIVHRDFKSNNVVLVPSEQSDGAVRVVVTDFGLARGSTAKESLTGSTTGAAQLVGTPAYMAPEQVEGGTITPAVDIYALGVVMYEMLTGAWPFAGDTPLSMAVKRLKEPPVSPRVHVKDLDQAWESVILRCLEQLPQNRFGSVREAIAALARHEATSTRHSSQHYPWTKARNISWAAVFIIILFAGGIGYYLRVTRRQPTAATEGTRASLPQSITARRSVAVLGFKNLSARPDVAWLSTALSEMLNTELAAGEKLRMIPGENVVRMKIDLSLSDADSYGTETLARIHNNLGADLVVLGSYSALGEKAGGKMRLDLRLQDAVAGETIASVAETGTQTELFELISRTGARLRERLNLGEVSAAEVAGVRASLPSRPEAARFYSEGLAKLLVFDALSARDLLEQAVATEPDYPLAHSALAAAWSVLGYDTKAKEAAKRAFDRSGNLSREDRLAVEARYQEAIHDWKRAAEIYRTLFSFFPDNLEYGLRLAAAETADGRGKDALVTIEALRRLPSPARDDARIDITEAQAAESLADFKRDRSAAVRAFTKGTQQGARLLTARARFLEGWALFNLGEPYEAMVACEEAKRIYLASGYQDGVARAVNNIANINRDQGNFNEAKAMYEEALAIWRKIGKKQGVAIALNNIATVLDNQGDLSGSTRMYEEGLAIYREIGDKSRQAETIGNQAKLLSERGDHSRARKQYEEALTLIREVGEKRLEAAMLSNLGATLSDLGDLAGARKNFEDALAIWRQMGNRSWEAQSLYGLGQVVADQGDLAAARKYQETSLAIRKELDEKWGMAESREELAALAIEEGRYAEVEPLARQAAEEFRRENAPDKEAGAHDVLARSLLGQRRLGDASAAIERAKTLAKPGGNRDLQLFLTVTQARVNAAAGKPAEAAKTLEAMIGEATKSGLINLEFEARLALGEIELQSGNKAKGQARLESLEKDARAKGFGLIARNAALAQRSTR